MSYNLLVGDDIELTYELMFADLSMQVLWDLLHWVWTAIGHDISNITIFPSCYLSWDKISIFINVILAMLIILSKPF